MERMEGMGMKNGFAKRAAALGMAAAMTLGCAAPALAQTEAHTVELREYRTYVGATADSVLTEPISLAFVDGVEDLPYVEIRTWAELLYFVNRELTLDANYGLSWSREGDVFELERENGYKMVLDFGSGLMTFEDFNGFLQSSDAVTLLDMVSEKGKDEDGTPLLIRRDGEASFDRYGDALRVDLEEYGIHLVREGDSYYVPLQTMNDFTLLPAHRYFLFNGAALFLVDDDTLYDYAAKDYTEIGRMFYDVPQADRSDALAEYSYSELCLALDYFYGLKGIHDITGFRQLFWEIGYDEALSGRSAEEADTALRSFINYYLDDLHSAFMDYSPLAGNLEVTGSNGIANRKYRAHKDAYLAARDLARPEGVPGYEEVGNTAYITFDSFTSTFNGAAFYEALAEGKPVPEDTIGLIIDAHRQITREGSPIENVVLDLSINGGGDVDAAVFLLGWFLGDASMSIKDMCTGAMSNAVYRADVNLDHVYDEKDTVADKSLYCLISPISFSCANLVPAALKNSQRVTLLGKTSGGGSCVVQPMSTAYGTLFQISAPQRMSFLKNGAFYDIDQGVEPDYYIDSLSHFYDRQALTDWINGLF